MLSGGIVCAGCERPFRPIAGTSDTVGHPAGNSPSGRRRPRGSAPCSSGSTRAIPAALSDGGCRTAWAWCSSAVHFEEHSATPIRRIKLSLHSERYAETDEGPLWMSVENETGRSIVGMTENIESVVEAQSQRAGEVNLHPTTEIAASDLSRT